MSSPTSSSLVRLLPCSEFRVNENTDLRSFVLCATAMAQYYPQQPQQGYGPQASAQNLQFFPTSYSSVSGHTTPSQASYGAGFGGAPNPAAQSYPIGGGYGGFGSPATGVSGRMGEQGGLRTGWLAAFGTEGYDGEPPLLEELGVNFEHIRTKVSAQVRGRRQAPGIFSSSPSWTSRGPTPSSCNCDHRKLTPMPDRR